MSPNGPTGAYFVQSSFVSSRPYGFLALRDELTRWRMASDRPDAWQVAASAPALDYVVAPGRPGRAIRTLTSLSGRQRVPPRWALRPQLDRLVRFPPQSAADYLAEVRRDLTLIRRYRMPVGSYRIEAWEFIPRTTLRRLIARFHASGIRVLLYFRGFVGRDEIGTDSPERFDEAVRRGYVATRADGSPYVFQSNFFDDAAMIDFTDPAARRWWTSRIREALDLGADGFMQDFGEQVAMDMHFDDGSTGRTMHNRFPVLFHRATRRAIDAFLADHPRRGQPYFFTRAGYSGTPGSVAYENATWPGDEPTDWSRSAGLAAQATDMLNRGIAGAYGFGTDIGGYFDVGGSPTSKELFLRWAEWAALTPIFRLHGSVAAGTHTPWSYDSQTVRIYRRLSRLHIAALPLVARLWRRAARTGMPIARPLWLAVPGDPVAARQDQEWMLGHDVLVAPVVVSGARARRVVLPSRMLGGATLRPAPDGPGLGTGCRAAGPPAVLLPVREAPLGRALGDGHQRRPAGRESRNHGLRERRHGRARLGGSEEREAGEVGEADQHGLAADRRVPGDREAHIAQLDPVHDRRLHLVRALERQHLAHQASRFAQADDCARPRDVERVRPQATREVDRFAAPLELRPQRRPEGAEVACERLVHQLGRGERVRLAGERLVHPAHLRLQRVRLPAGPQRSTR